MANVDGVPANKVSAKIIETVTVLNEPRYSIEATMDRVKSKVTLPDRKGLPLRLGAAIQRTYVWPVAADRQVPDAFYRPITAAVCNVDPVIDAQQQPIDPKLLITLRKASEQHNPLVGDAITVSILQVENIWRGRND